MVDICVVVFVVVVLILIVVFVVKCINKYTQKQQNFDLYIYWLVGWLVSYWFLSERISEGYAKTTDVRQSSKDGQLRLA